MDKTASFIIGGLVGAGIALLVAPRSGAETRAQIAATANDFVNTPTANGASVKETWDNAVAKGEELFTKTSACVTDTVGSAYTKVANVAGAASVKAQDAVAVASTQIKDTFTKAGTKAQTVVEEEVIPVFTDEDDELRAKMEMARQRIAEQVAKNAAEAKARAEAAAAEAAVGDASGVEATPAE